MIRVVFVDDEVNVLQAMRRSTHAMRDEWSMEFVSSGAAALETLATLPADVLVCDMRMPGMDGWQVLAEVKKLSPQTVRLVLSGYGEPGAIMRSVGTAHQYLAKPCDGATLKTAIVQSQRLRQLLSSETLATLVGGVGMLPPAPHVFQELLACLQKPKSSVSDVARIVGRDVAMTANIMKLVNSAFFGSRRPITTPDRAVAYLGLDTLGALVLAHGVFKNGASDDAAGFSHERLWQHSLQTAMAARALALHQNFPHAVAEEAFLAGVLHDVGKVVLATRPAAAGEATDDSREEAQAQMRTYHAEAGAYLLGLWGFPTPIVEAVAFHHAPSHATDNGLGLPGIIHIADRLVHQRTSESQNTTQIDVEAGFLEGLGLVDHLPQWSAALNVLDGERATT
jgi:HD-like signal output (HDOD) protein